MVESVRLSMFHLRRVQFQAYVGRLGNGGGAELVNDAMEPSGNQAVCERSTMILLDRQTKIGRNPELVDVVLHSVVHSNMISRDHSEIVGEQDEKGSFVRYYISDRSLNGTYVNDTRVKENVLLREGDLIKFGHVNGAAIKPGEVAPQHAAEFIFRFERALPEFAYFGYTQNGPRTQHSEQRRAYMQINSDRVLPTEVYTSATLTAASGTVVPPQKPAAAAVTNSGVASTAAVSASTSAPCAAINNAAKSSQLAHLAAVAAATTLANSQQQSTTQYTLSALNQLGLASASEEQVAAVNAHLRSLMASHDAMSAMERLAAQQQWNNSLLKLSSLQQQNPLVYGHAFPAAAAAAAALFTGCIDLHQSAAANPGATAAAQYAASLWPGIRALQPQQTADWTQQQKAAALAQQLQLRLPGGATAVSQLYPAGQQHQATGQQRQQPTASTPSLFGAPSAFSLPASQINASVALPSSSAGLLIAAHQKATQQHGVAAAYSSCTSALTSSLNNQCRESPIAALSRGTSSSSLQPQATADQLTAAAARLAAAQQLAKEALDVDKKGGGWPMGISCTTSGSAKVSPVIVAAAAVRQVAAIPPFNGPPQPPVVSSAATSLQRLPGGIASALAAAVAVAQQQQQAHANGVTAATWASASTPPVSGAPPQLGTSPVQHQPLPQRILSSSSTSANSSGLSLSAGSTKSSSGVSSAPSTAALLQSPMAEMLYNSGEGNRDSLVSPSSANVSSLLGHNSSAFLANPHLQNNTNLNTLTAAMFAQQRQRMAVSTSEDVKQEQPDDERRHKMLSLKRDKSDRELPVTEGQKRHLALNGSSSSISTDLGQLQLEKAETGSNEKKMRGELMECDSSVPSPPSSKQLQPRFGSTSSSSGRVGSNEEEKLSSVAVEAMRKRRSSDSGSSGIVNDDDADNSRNKRNREEKRSASNTSKPRPIKQARKSNEVARLLNDLTAGNCTQWGNRKLNCNGDWRKKYREKMCKWASCEGDDEAEEDEDSLEVVYKLIERNKGKTVTSGDGNQRLKCTIKKPNEQIAEERRELDTISSLVAIYGKNDQGDFDNAKMEEAEVEELLNGGSWQYMAERSQKLATKGSKNNAGGGNNSRGEEADGKSTVGNAKNTNRKKPMRLEERKRAEMERKRAHKMMRQISDESSDDEGHNNSREDKKMENSDEERRHEQQGHIKLKPISSNSTNSDGSSNATDLDSDRRNRRTRYNKEKPRPSAASTNLLANGGSTNGPTTGKRKLLSSAPGNGTKKSNNVGKRRSQEKAVEKPSKEKLTNGSTQEEMLKKRGPKMDEAKKFGRGVLHKASSNMATSAAVTPRVLAKRKPGRKAGSGRGRPSNHAATSDNEEENSHSSADESLQVMNGGKAAMVNGGGMRPKKGRKSKEEGLQRMAGSALVEDWTGGSGDPELCAHKKCQRPVYTSINWVQCDDCDLWFHSTCVFGTNITPDDDADFHCGCANGAVEIGNKSNGKNISASAGV